MQEEKSIRQIRQLATLFTPLSDNRVNKVTAKHALSKENFDRIYMINRM